LQLAGPSVHLPFVQVASVSHCAVVEAGSQGCPSAMIVGHVPVGSALVPSSAIGQVPCEQNRSSPSHVPPGATNVMATHLKVASHANPTPQSPPLHDAPADSGVVQVRDAAPVQMRPDAQSVFSEHVPPAAIGAAHVPDSFPFAKLRAQ
jgi:hypothetical protein